MEGRRSTGEYPEEIRRAERARLTVYVGFVAGIGKTYRMLADTRDLKGAGVDVDVQLVP